MMVGFGSSGAVVRSESESGFGDGADAEGAVGGADGTTAVGGRASGDNWPRGMMFWADAPPAEKTKATLSNKTLFMKSAS